MAELPAEAPSSPRLSGGGTDTDPYPEKGPVINCERNGKNPKSQKVSSS